MGSTIPTTKQSFQHRFKQKYQFISQIHDNNFGDIKVYRKKQLNYDYVMILYKYIQSNKLSQLQSQIKLLHAAFLQQNQPMALRIFNYDIDNNYVTNCSLALVKIYVEYFNFTLYDLMEIKRNQHNGFNYEEFKYLVYSTIAAYKQFKAITHKNINISPKSIYLSPQGAIKFCPIRNQQFYQHPTPVFNAICNQTIYKQIDKHQNGQKYLTSQIKKLFTQISKLNHQQQTQYDKILQLFQRIKKCYTISQVTQKLSQPKIEVLNISNSNKIISKTNSNDKKQSYSSVSKPISSTSNLSQRFKTNDGDSVKLSLTKYNKSGNSKQAKEYSREGNMYQNK